jgi:hypothetical protein
MMMMIIIALLGIFMLFTAVISFTWSSLTSVTHTLPLLLLETLTLYSPVYVNRLWLLTLFCHLKCLLQLPFTYRKFDSKELHLGMSQSFYLRPVLCALNSLWIVLSPATLF